MQAATGPDHVEGVPDRVFDQEARDLERDIRERLRARSLRYRALLLRRVVCAIEERLFRLRTRRYSGEVEHAGKRSIREPAEVRMYFR